MAIVQNGEAESLLLQVFAQIQREQQISPGDFPNLARMKEQLQHHDFTKFNPIKPKLLENVDKMLANDIARLMTMIPQVSRCHRNYHAPRANVLNPFVPTLGLCRY